MRSLLFGVADQDVNGVTRDDIIWCYQRLLNREPESEEVVQVHLAADSLRTLVQSFVASAEFQNIRAARAFHPIPLPQARIDVSIDAPQLEATIAKVKLAWSHLGETRPHFSVMTNQAFLPEKLAGSIHHFWASGDIEAGHVTSLLATHGVAPEGRVCVEYGCGVGRVTGGLAQRFEQVHGYDISAQHLVEAQERIRSLGLRNVSFVQCSDTVLEDLHPCDVFYSRIVFQHNPPPLIAVLIRSALKALKPGGIAIFQVPTYAEGYSFEFDAWIRAEEALDMEMHCLPQPCIFQAIAAAGCLTLEVREDESTGDARFISNTFVVRRPT